MKSARCNLLVLGTFALYLCRAARAFAPHATPSTVSSSGTTRTSSHGDSLTLISRSTAWASPTLLRFSQDEESEWYTPPPPAPKQPKELPSEHTGGGLSTPIKGIRSHVELEEFLNLDNRLCVVKFHASWCKSCQKFGLKFDKLASQHGGGVDKEGVDHSVRFAAVEWGANTALCKSLGVKKLPTTMLYSQGKKVTSLTVGPSRFTELREAVERYATFSPAEFEFEARLEQGKKLMEETARRERFEEVAKARRRPTRSRMPSIPPQATVLKAFSTPTPSTGSSEGSSAVDQLRSRLDL